MTRQLASLLAALLLLATPGAAGRSLGDEWHDKMVRSTKALRAGDSARALKLSTSVVEDMVDSLGPGQEATLAFGTALTHRALALAGLGRSEEALWYWHIVLGLYPGFGRSDLGSFGEPGAFLLANPLHPETSPGDAAPEPFDPGGFVAPKEISRRAPKFPEGARGFRTTGTLVVSVTITEKGTVSSPRVLSPLPAPTLSYAALEAIRRWRYEPATRDGKPVPVRLNVTVTFRLE